MVAYYFIPTMFQVLLQAMRFWFCSAHSGWGHGIPTGHTIHFLEKELAKGIKMKTPLESLCTLLDILNASLSAFLVHCWGSKKLPQENRPASAEKLHHRVCTQNHWKTNALCSNKLLTTPKHACKHSPKNHWRSWKFPEVVRIHGIPVCHLLTREIHWFPDIKVTIFGAAKGSQKLVQYRDIFF